MKRLENYLIESLIKKDTILKYHKYNLELLYQKIDTFDTLIDILKQYFEGIKYEEVDDDMIYVGHHSYEVNVDKLICFKFEDKILYVGKPSNYDNMFYMNIGYYDKYKGHSPIVPISNQKTLYDILQGMYEWIDTSNKNTIKEYYNLFNYKYEKDK